DRRQDSAGHRGSALAHRQGHLRDLPRLRRADRAGAAERDSVDARLHHVQGKAELVSDVLALLQEFYRDKLAMLLSHQAGARFVGQYDQNNTYQYIINREETQLSWVAKAISDPRGAAAAAQQAPGRDGKGSEAAHTVFEEDVR